MQGGAIMNINIYPVSKQGYGEFDGGNITEHKPIAFPHEETAVKRVGTLFYWAWGFTKTSGEVGFHPHKGFEIVSYLLDGRLAHKDTLGTESTIHSGGVQVMQTGSGVQHAEGFSAIDGKDASSFQIWFEPFLNEAVKREPTYRQFEHEDFPIVQEDGITVKTLIGQDSPLTIVTDAKMHDITLESGKNYQYTIQAGYSNAAIVVEGSGSLVEQNTNNVSPLSYKDFIVIDAENQSEISFQSKNEDMRIVIIQVPTTVDYPLYRK